MLSKKQFKAKHAKKFAKQGLTDQQINARYQDYKNTRVMPQREVQYRSLKGQDLRKPKLMNRNEQIVNVPVLSPCSRLYVRALTNPFAFFEHPPCIPDVICLPSYKYSSKVRGTMTVGTAGVGWVSVDPFSGAVNDQPSVYHTNSVYALGNFTPGAPGTAADNSDAPLNLSDIANCRVRTVGCGLRMRFQGSEFQRGGNVILYRQAYNQSLTSGFTEVDFLKDRTASQTPATRKWECVCYRPTSFNALTYGPIGGSTNGTLIIYVTGATPGQSWCFEVISYFELIGNRAEKTASHSDPNGMSAIAAALSETPVLASPPNKQEMAATNSAMEQLKEQSGWQSFLLEGGKSVASGLASLAGGPLGGIAASLLMNGTQSLATNSLQHRGAQTVPLIEEMD